MNLVLNLHSDDYTTLIWKKVIKVVSCCVMYNLTIMPMSFFWVGVRVKDKLTKLRFRCQSQPPGRSKWDNICDMDTTSRRGEVLIFKPKFHIIFIKPFLYINIFLSKINQNCGFWANQGFSLEEMPVFVDFSLLGGWILM